MSKYTLVVRIPQAGNKEINYSVNLSGLNESYPEDYFRQESHRLVISQTIEQQSARKVTPENLNSIIANWILDIKRGFHRTIVTLDLSLDSAMSLTSPVPANHTITAPAKQPIQQPSTPSASVIQPAKIPKTSIQNSSHSHAAETPTENPKTAPPDIRADTNKADF